MGSDHPTATGGNEWYTTQGYSSEEKALMREIISGLRQPTGNVGQQANGNLHICCSQAQKMTFVLK